MTGETPVHLIDSGKIIFQFIPFVAFEPGFNININVLQKNIELMTPAYSFISGSRYNLDGFVAYSQKENNLFGSYFQVFRNGIIEMVDTSIIRPNGNQRYIPSFVFEDELIKLLKNCIYIHQNLSVVAPSTLIISLTGVKGYRLAVNQKLDRWGEHTHLIDRDSLILPEVVIEDYFVEPATLLRPIFDALWNSAGWARSFGYDEAGQWEKGKNR